MIALFVIAKVFAPLATKLSLLPGANAPSCTAVATPDSQSFNQRLWCVPQCQKAETGLDGPDPVEDQRLQWPNPPREVQLWRRVRVSALLLQPHGVHSERPQARGLHFCSPSEFTAQFGTLVCVPSEKGGGLMGCVPSLLLYLEEASAPHWHSCISTGEWVGFGPRVS